MEGLLAARLGMVAAMEGARLVWCRHPSHGHWVLLREPGVAAWARREE